MQMTIPSEIISDKGISSKFDNIFKPNFLMN